MRELIRFYRLNKLLVGMTNFTGFTTYVFFSFFATGHVTGVQSAGWLDIHFTVGISCVRAAPLAGKHGDWRHHLLTYLISLHNEHSVFPWSIGHRIRSRQLSLMEKRPNIMSGPAVTPLCCIWELSGSNLAYDTECLNWDFFMVFTSDKCRNCTII
jgi:hypothetical protein